MHFEVLFLLLLSLQHLAEIRLLRKRNLEMKSDFVMQVCLYGLHEAPISSMEPGLWLEFPLYIPCFSLLFSAFLFASFHAQVMLSVPPLLGWCLLPASPSAPLLFLHLSPTQPSHEVLPVCLGSGL